MAGQHKYNRALHRRLFDARKQLEMQLGRPVTLLNIAEGVGRILGERPPYFTTVGKWMQGQEPSISRHMWALAKFLQVDPGDLLFGGTPGNRPMPEVPRGRTGDLPKRFEQEVAVEGRGRLRKAASRRPRKGR